MSNCFNLLDKRDRGWEPDEAFAESAATICFYAKAKIYLCVDFSIRFQRLLLVNCVDKYHEDIIVTAHHDTRTFHNQLKIYF